MLGLLKGPLDSSLSSIPDLTDLIHHLGKQDIRSKRIQNTSLLSLVNIHTMGVG
jgi:hypothetical protein